MDSPAPRLTVLLAAEAPAAVVLRRGPTDWVRLSHWDTATDEMQHGQWMRARVYESRCDVSPDGRLFVAFVRKDVPPALANAESWIAVSQVPNFTALALWFIGSTWCPGGYFAAVDRLWIGTDDAPDVGDLPRWLRLVTADDAGIGPIQGHNRIDNTVLHNRLLRDGWEPVEDATTPTWHKPLPGGQVLLRTDRGDAQPGGTYEPPTEFAVISDSRLDVLADADWADVDQTGRIVVARRGRIEHWLSPEEQRVIADVSDQSPDPRPADSDAAAWPQPPGSR